MGLQSPHYTGKFNLLSIHKNRRHSELLLKNSLVNISVQLYFQLIFQNQNSFHLITMLRTLIILQIRSWLYASGEISNKFFRRLVFKFYQQESLDSSLFYSWDQGQWKGILRPAMAQPLANKNFNFQILVSRKIPIQNKKLSTEYHFPVKSAILFFVCSNLFKRYFSRVQFSVYLLASAIYKLETDLYFENILGLLVTCAN